MLTIRSYVDVCNYFSLKVNSFSHTLLSIQYNFLWWQIPYFAVYNAHFFAQMFEGKIRVHYTWVWLHYHGYNNPMYMYKNMGAHYTRERATHNKIWYSLSVLSNTVATSHKWLWALGMTLVWLSNWRFILFSYN